MVLWSMEIMQFKVVDSVWSGEINTIYLVNNNWDDWFTYVLSSKLNTASSVTLKQVFYSA